MGPFLPVGPLHRQGLFNQSDADGMTGCKPAAGLAITAAEYGAGAAPGGGIVGIRDGLVPGGVIGWAKTGPAAITVVSNTPAIRCFALMPPSRRLHPTRRKRRPRPV